MLLSTGTLWTPALLPSKLVFVDDDSLATDISGGVVTTWTSKQGLNSPTQSNATKKPAGSTTGGPNNLGYVETDGVDDFLRVTFTLAAQPYFVFAVMQKVGAAQNNPRFFDGGSSGTMDLFCGGAAPGSNSVVSMNAGAGIVNSNAATLTDWNRYECQFNGASSKIKIGDGAYATGTCNAAAPGGLILGCWGDQSSSPIQARYNTVIVCSAIPSADDLAALHQWAKNRTGV